MSGLTKRLWCQSLRDTYSTCCALHNKQAQVWNAKVGLFKVRRGTEQSGSEVTDEKGMEEECGGNISSLISNLVASTSLSGHDAACRYAPHKPANCCRMSTPALRPMEN